VIRTLVSASAVPARAGLAAIVRGDARLQLVGEASADDLARSLAAFEPDVLLEQRDDQNDEPQIPYVALVDDPRDAWAQLLLDGSERGPCALLASDASSEEIAAAVVAVAAGLVAVQPRALGSRSEAERHRDAERLTSRELEVLGELARGVPNKTIASRLAISEHTVKFHIASIFAKLAVSSRTEAVTQGVRLGLIML